jgi:ABC-type glycerol-3-phosphate transport system substrate-binding protein
MGRITRAFIAVIAVALLPMAAFASADAETAAGEPVIPDVYIFSTSNAQPSTPEALEEIQEEVVKRIGIRPHSIFSPSQQADEKLALLLSSGERLDTFKDSWPEFSARNVIRPIGDLLDSHGGSIREWLRPSLWPTVTDPEGVIWGIPNNSARLANPVWIRADWLERYDKPVPATIAELGELLEFFKQEDPAGNGNTIVLLMDLRGMNMTLAAGYLEAGWPNWYDRSTGSIRHSVEDPAYRDYLALMRDWFEAGYINLDFFNIKMTDMRAHVASGVVPVVGAWYSSVTHTASAQLAEMDPNARYLMVPELRGPEGVAESAYPQNTGGAVMITAFSREPEAAMQFLNYAYSGYDAYALLRYGIEGKDFEWGTRAPDFGIINTLDRLGTGRYQGEFVRGTSLSMTVLSDKFALGSDNPALGMIYDYIFERGQFSDGGMFDFGRAKESALHNVIVDWAKVQEEVQRSDLDRMVEEETLKFVLGTRPLSEYDQFLADLDRIGLQRLNELLTEAYVASGALN